MKIGKYKLSFFDVLYILIGIPWFFLMLFTSRLYTEVKVVMLIVLMMVCVMEYNHRKMKMIKKHVVFVTWFIIFCFMSLLWGILLGYEFSIANDYALIQYYIITPICVLFLSTTMDYDNRKKVIWELIKYLTCLMCVLDVVRISLYMIGIEPAILSFIMMASDRTDTELSLRVSNEVALFFLLPIFVYLLINPDSKSKKDRFIYAITVSFGIVYSVISGRKMLEIVVFLAFIFALVYRNGIFSLKVFFSKTVFKLLFIVVLAIRALQYVFKELADFIGVDDILAFAFETITEGLSSDAEGVSSRTENTIALLNLWLDSLLWGNGLNSYAANSLASLSTKWSYEVVYIAWLAQTGIVGVCFLVVPVIYVIKTLNKMGRLFKNDKYYALMIGFASFVFAGSSNPLVYLVWPWSIVLITCVDYERIKKQRYNFIKLESER